ncbi:hypothetical protein JFP838_pA0322 (plasmid) [Clostridium perfringens]|uniref:Uncharacterized protein n=2 Tax=Clostridium perfringens TaxID=1502 RepID=A0A140GRS9_CLOPF|nr:hypothetical protein JFP838_pA0322 [Clostridium perfringens]
MYSSCFIWNKNNNIFNTLKKKKDGLIMDKYYLEIEKMLIRIKRYELALYIARKYNEELLNNKYDLKLTKKIKDINSMEDLYCLLLQINFSLSYLEDYIYGYLKNKDSIGNYSIKQGIYIELYNKFKELKD